MTSSSSSDTTTLLSSLNPSFNSNMNTPNEQIAQYFLNGHLANSLSPSAANMDSFRDLTALNAHVPMANKAPFKSSTSTPSSSTSSSSISSSFSSLLNSNYSNQNYGHLQLQNLPALPGPTDNFLNGASISEGLMNELVLSMAFNQFNLNNPSNMGAYNAGGSDQQNQMMNLYELNMKATNMAALNNDQSKMAFFGGVDQNNNNIYGNMDFGQAPGGPSNLIDSSKFGNNIYMSLASNQPYMNENKPIMGKSIDNNNNNKLRRRYNSYSNASENPAMSSSPSPPFRQNQISQSKGSKPFSSSNHANMNHSLCESAMSNGKMSKCFYRSCDPATFSNQGNQESSLIQFKCNHCQAMKPIHRHCYENMLSDRSKANLASNGSDRKRNYSLSQIFESNPRKTGNYFQNDPSRLSCPDCQNGDYCEFSTSKMTPQPTKSVGNMKNAMSNYNPVSNTMNNNPSGLMHTNTRKRSFCINNPPLSTPMKPVRESRSPSPANDTNSSIGQLSASHLMNSNSNIPKSYKNAQKPSFADAMPKNHRTRTMSAGSPGSTLYASGYSEPKKAPNMNHRKSECIAIKKPSNEMGSKSREKAHSLNFGNSMAFSLGDVASSFNSTGSLLENLGEKLAATGNMFYSRVDWAILNKVPYNKQNSIHIRLEDEGPYGNDETRCFVLSHLSSLKIREIKCCICENVLLIYDQFPLIDGTLFVSPVNYDSMNGSLDDHSRSQSPLTSSSSSSSSIAAHMNNSKTVNVSGIEIKSSSDNLNQQQSQSELQIASSASNQNVPAFIPATISNKNQFIYAICLDCLHGAPGSGAKTEEVKVASPSPTTPSDTPSSPISPSDANSPKEENEPTKAVAGEPSSPSSSLAIQCKYCKQPWSGGSVLQIGTMYKYEIFAAFPCCQKRYACSNCSKPVINEPLPYFSAYSEERECPHCHTKDYHFIKPLTKLFDIPTRAAPVASSSLSMSPAPSAVANDNELGGNNGSDILFML